MLLTVVAVFKAQHAIGSGTVGFGGGCYQLGAGGTVKFVFNVSGTNAASCTILGVFYFEGA